jgi:cytidyltransferase-like protein
MIVDFDSLKTYRHSVAMVDGCFDPLHKGHVEYFRAARELGVPLLCNLASDKYLATKHPPFLPEDHRAAILDSNRYIELTHINHLTTTAVLKELQPKYYVKGRDWLGRLPSEQINVCHQVGTEIVYLDTVSNSSAKILEDYCSDKRDMTLEVKGFEEFILNQDLVSPDHYAQEYFTDEWRGEGNSYQLETRRKIEGRNPELIKEVFQPKRVLDMGCGPGALMYLLNELDVSCDGIDISPPSRELAPPEVRDRIMIGPITERIVPDNSYDLVICREVLEHLTVLQIRRAIQNMCRATSKYVYVTTRFHPDPPSFLAITNQFELDPTHITLMSKEFLRVLFLLEGCRSLPNLEARMDWLNKGRVLVFEKF